MEAGEVVFQDLLNGKIQYRVPLFQRTYSWEEHHWQRLWDDILEVYALETPQTHFLGAIVTLPIPDSPEHVNKYMLIDGQQRLTTLFILLSVLRERAVGEEATERLAEQIRDECLENKYATKEDERDKLQPTQADRMALKAVLSGGTFEQHSRIMDASAFFRKAVEVGDLEGEDIDLPKLKSCLTNYLSLVSIKLDQDDSPHRIFESLNNTGMALTASDLVRNYVFMQLADDEERLNSVYHSHWLPMQRRTEDEDGKSHLSNFFWRFLMKAGELPRYDEVYQGMRNWVVQQQAAGQSICDTLAELNRFSQHYIKLWRPVPNESCPEIRVQMERINRWEVDVAYPFLLAVMEEREKATIDEEAVLAVLKMIESYVVRRAVCGIPTNRLRRVFARMSTQVLDGNDFVAGTRKYLTNNEWPTDDVFRERFLSARMYNSSRLPRTRIFLSSLERSFDHHEPIEMGDGITIEHIMPQTMSDEWREHLGSDADQTHGLYLHTIGNLTYSGYNTEMGNKPFDQKKNILRQSHFEMNRQIIECEKWTRQEIENRAAAMADRALVIWQR
ncbi:DUF262 domain-containing protein [bacterium AH-315-M10]|nr:DUF262 domain-containing protein [bacterium AH-315-M10]